MGVSVMGGKITRAGGPPRPVRGTSTEARAFGLRSPALNGMVGSPPATRLPVKSKAAPLLENMAKATAACLVTMVQGAVGAAVKWRRSRRSVPAGRL